MDSIERKQTP